MYTIKDLFEACKEQIEAGNGDKQILISRDDEGNGYHRLNYLFVEDVWDYTDNGEMRMSEEEFNNSIILG